MTAVRVLLQTALLPIFGEGLSSAADIKAWLANQNYYVDSDITKSSFTLRASDPAELRQALANDLNRLASASFESAAGVAPEASLPRSLAWGSIRSYYAAFFAAHGVMRLFGTACVQLDDEHVDHVFAAAQAFGKNGNLTALDKGLFAANIGPAFDTISFSRLRDSHKDTWSTLLAVFESLEAAIPSATALSSHKIEAASLLTVAKSGLTRSGSTLGNWLSITRNSINYRHSHGVWYPYTRSAQTGLLDAASRAWKASPTPHVSTLPTSDLDSFFFVSTGLVALLRELIITAAGLNSPLNPVFDNGCLRLLNEVIRPRRR